MAALLVLALLAGVSAVPQLGDVTRHESGDTFTLIEDTCGPDQCAEYGAGARSWDGGGEAQCACACPPRAPLFREDRELCVDDLPECSLATFGTESGLLRIPFVYLPLKGQIIHPSKEIMFQGVKTPICAVSGAQFLTRKGFLDLRSNLDADVPFALFRDEGRTFLQWSGEDELRKRMSGRVVLVRLLCRDVESKPASPVDLRGVFTPCVAFRVQGTPPRHSLNVTEVSFAPNAHTFEAAPSGGLSTSEYVAIGVSSLLLGLIYVASVFLYLHIRKRRKTSTEDGSTRKLRGLKNKDGTSITEQDIVRINNERSQMINNPIGEENGVVKKNPLLSMGRQFHDMKGNFPSDSGSTFSDSDDFTDGTIKHEDIRFHGLTSAVVHSQRREVSASGHSAHSAESAHHDESGIERLPDEHVSIVETTDDREIARPVGTTRRKLYFNPAYFEPHLMAEPPPAALEFLVKIREVIAIAKHKMAAKRFQPVLNKIPEEETYPSNANSIDLYQGLGSRSGSVVSLKRENSRKKSVSCVGCPGCTAANNNEMLNFFKHDVPACSTCIHNRGDKQANIRKWLENIPTIKERKENQISSDASIFSLPAENLRKLRKQNSFTHAKPPHRGSGHHKAPRKTSTLSVRSEPPIRNYNLPLPEFSEMQHNNYLYYGQTISQVEDIKPVGFNNLHGSIRHSLSNMKTNNFLTNNHVLPDMVNEAVALDHCSKIYNQSSSDEERMYNTIAKDVEVHLKARNMPNTAVEYETDSLERSSKKGGVTPTETDISSQASPSLSTALPLEEELTMTNSIYKPISSSNSNTPSPYGDIKRRQNLYESMAKERNNIHEKQNKLGKDSHNKDYSLVTEVYVNNNYNFESIPPSPSRSDNSLASRNTTEAPGCLTIEVKDSPENYIKVNDSDGFEPDTLDRKHCKHKIDTTENAQFSRKEFVKSLSTQGSPVNQRIQLRSSGTFTKSNVTNDQINKFNSLRSLYDDNRHGFERPPINNDTFSRAKSVDGKESDSWDEVSVDWTTEEGRILTLELRHSKRQRQITPPSAKQLKPLARPDVLPPLPPTEDHGIYELPIKPPRRVVDEPGQINMISKNDNGRSLSPRTYTPNQPNHKLNSNFKKTIGSSCSLTRASVQSSTSDYEEVTKKEDLSRTSGRKRSNRNGGINTNTFVKSKDDNSKSRFRKKKGSHLVEDSGYLSSDSTGSRKVQRKIVVAKLVSCSESEDTENEARSESGAESVETHSVFFGSIRKIPEDVAFNLSRKSNRLLCKSQAKQY